MFIGSMEEYHLLPGRGSGGVRLEEEGMGSRPSQPRVGKEGGESRNGRWREKKENLEVLRSRPSHSPRHGVRVGGSCGSDGQDVNTLMCRGPG